MNKFISIAIILLLSVSASARVPTKFVQTGSRVTESAELLVRAQTASHSAVGATKLTALTNYAASTTQAAMVTTLDDLAAYSELVQAITEGSE